MLCIPQILYEAFNISYSTNIVACVCKTLKKFFVFLTVVKVKSYVNYVKMGVFDIKTGFPGKPIFTCKLTSVENLGK